MADQNPTMLLEQPVASTSFIAPPPQDARLVAKPEIIMSEAGLDQHPGHGSGKGKEKELESSSLEAEIMDDVTEMDEDEEDYEEERRRRIQENQRLLSQLGIDPSATPITPQSSQTIQRNRTHRRKREGHRIVYDRSGYLISQPGPGEIHRMACVEIPANRALSKRISDGEYQDCIHWAEGERRRWRFGFGRGVEVDGEEEDEGGVTKEFRWRRWKGLKKELMREMSIRGELIERDARPAAEPVVEQGEVSAYSLIPGESCHQCRRKSEKPKMRCRNVNPPCRASFCETCCKRYSYFTFDEESRSFICPLCKDCCNCSNCIRKRNLEHLLGPKRGGVKASFVALTKSEGLEGMTVQSWLEKAVENKVGVPFDRVRLVDQDKDIISPVIEDLEEVVQVVAKGVKKRKAKNDGPKEKKVKKIKGYDGKASLVVKLKVPKLADLPTQKRLKEVDSDGDTIGGWSDNEDGRGRRESSLTPLSDESTPLPPRLAFPPRPSVLENDYLASLVHSSPPVPVYSETFPNQVDNPNHPYAAMPTLADHLHLPVMQPSPPQTIRNISSQGSVPGSGRRKPPPKANIIRAPRHSQTPPERARHLPQFFDTTSTNYWPTHSHDSQANIPPARQYFNTPYLVHDHGNPTFNPIPYPQNQMDYPNPSMAMDMNVNMNMNLYSQYPPPYSHSPGNLGVSQTSPTTRTSVPAIRPCSTTTTTKCLVKPGTTTEFGSAEYSSVRGETEPEYGSG